MAYLDYPGLAYFKSLLDETYLRTSYTGDTTIAGDVTFTGNTVFSEDITGNVDGKAKKDWRGQQIDSTYIKEISTNDNVGQIVYTKGDGTSNYIMIDMMQGATASAAGKAGLVPAPTISERTKFLRGDGEWGVPTDIYVTQNLINTNDSFPILIGATAGATESQIGTAIAFGTKVSVNPNTHALIADHLILKHPTYRRDNAVTSKVMYTLNFADSNDGNGNNLSEIYGYIDKPSEGGEHELGFRLFGNPNVQGVEEIFTYLSVGLSKTNVPYGHAPSTPLPADHNEGTDIITRDWLARNGSETGLVHTTMNETIDGTKTFVKKIVANDGMNAMGNIASDTLTVRQDATVGRDLAVTRNETVGGTLTTTGNISTASGNISTTNGTISGKTGSIGTGGLTVTGPSNLNGGASVTGNETISGTLTVGGKITGNGGAAISGGNGLQVTGNETVSGNLTVGGTTTTEDLTVTDDATVGDDLTVNGDSLIKGNETVKGDETVEGDIIVKGSVFKTTKDGDEYVTYITKQSEIRNTIINNMADTYTIKNNNSKLSVDFTNIRPADLAKITPHIIENGGGLVIDSITKTLKVEFKNPSDEFLHNFITSILDTGGGLYMNETEFLYAGDQYYNAKRKAVDVTVDMYNTEDKSGNPAFKNPNFKKLRVDFSAIGKETKEIILNGLDLQVPLSSDITVYVDSLATSETETFLKGSNSLSYKIIERTGKPRTSDDEEDDSIKPRPFLSLANAIEWASSKLALGKYKVTILVVGSNDIEHPRVYLGTSTWILPEVNSSSGYVIIDTYNGIKDVLLSTSKYKDGYHPNIMAASSGSCKWVIKHLIFDYEYGSTTRTGLALCGIGALTSGANVHLRGCDFYARPERAVWSKTLLPSTLPNPNYVEGGSEPETIPNPDYVSRDMIKEHWYETSAPTAAQIQNGTVDYYTRINEMTGKNFTIRLIDADAGGEIRLIGDELGCEIHTEVISGGTVSIDILNVSRSASMYFIRTDPPTGWFDAIITNDGTNDTVILKTGNITAGPNDVEITLAAIDTSSESSIAAFIAVYPEAVRSRISNVASEINEKYLVRRGQFANYSVSGSCTRFLNMWQIGTTNVMGGSGIQVAFVNADPNNPLDGVPYRLTGGSHSFAPASGYVGSGTGYIEESTGCWRTGTDV